MVETTDQDVNDLARRVAERAVYDLLRAQHGSGAVVQRPISPELSIPTPGPSDYTAGIVAARKLSAFTRSLMVEYAQKSRGEGRSWRELAEPMAVEVGEYEDPASAAFEAVAGCPPMPHDQRWTGWRCGSCGKRVVDYGPYNNNPATDEKGHAEDCARHRADLAGAAARFDD